MTPDTDIEDTSKALYSEGSWHIMHKDTWVDKFFSYDYPHMSVIYHQCRNHWLQNKGSIVCTPAVHYRIDPAELDIACGHCGETCPEGLQGLWLLHNYDSLQSDPI